MNEPEKRNADGRFAPGNSANPGGRKPLTPEQKEMKYGILSKALERLHEKINDDAYMNGLKPPEFVDMETLAFDRCGLPRITRNEFEGELNTPQNSVTGELLDRIKNMHKST